MAEKQDEGSFFWQNDTLSHKDSSKSSRSGLRHCQRPGPPLDESGSVLWRKTYQQSCAQCPIGEEMLLNWSHHSDSQILYGSALPTPQSVEDKKMLFSVASGSVSLPMDQLI